LRFVDTNDDEDSLYCHKSTLSLWFGVLKEAIETDAAESADAPDGPSLDQPYQTIAMLDDDIEVFEEALGIIFPSLPLTTVSMDNARELLLLADKYDGPILKGEAPGVTVVLANMHAYMPCHLQTHVALMLQ
jgi:hypothetical protein